MLRRPLAEGLAAVLVGYANFMDVSVTYAGAERTIHDIETYIGILIGAVTFSGSVIAFGKLSGKMSGGQIFLPAHQLINYGLLAGILVLGAMAFFVVGRYQEKIRAKRKESKKRRSRKRKPRKRKRSVPSTVKEVLSTGKNNPSPRQEPP